jgi:hypothetical protein
VGRGRRSYVDDFWRDVIGTWPCSATAPGPLIAPFMLNGNSAHTRRCNGIGHVG